MERLLCRLGHLSATTVFALLLSSSTVAQPDNGTLNGEYIITTYFDDSVDGRSTSLSTVDFEGDGTGTWVVDASSIGDTGSGSFTYEVRNDTTVTLMVDGSVLHGVIEPSGEALTAVEVEAGAFGIYAAMRTTSGLTNADLTGEYAAVQYINDSVDGVSTAFSTLTFDGAGGGAFEILIHSLGEIGNGTFTYTLADDGRLTVLIDGGTLIGVFNPDTNGLTLVEVDPNAFGIYIALETSSGNTEALLSGRYGMTGYESDRQGQNALSELHAMTFDGAGSVDFQIVENSEGEMGSGTTTYTVNDDGTFELPDVGVTRGIVDVDGGWFVFGEIGPDDLAIRIGFTARIVVANEESPSVPTGLALTVGPNPSDGAAVVRFETPRSAHVRLEVFDVLGRRKAILVDEFLRAGSHAVPWSTADIEAGRYLFRLTVDDITIVQQGVVL